MLEIFRGIEQGLADTDYSCQVFTVLDSEDRERVFENCGRRARTDGVLLVWMPPTRRLVEGAQSNDVPIVLLDSSYPGICSIAVDHDAAAANRFRTVPAWVIAARID